MHASSMVASEISAEREGVTEWKSSCRHRHRRERKTRRGRLPDNIIKGRVLKAWKEEEMRYIEHNTGQGGTKNR
jgi:hypothetical protein